MGRRQTRFSWGWTCALAAVQLLVCAGCDQQEPPTSFDPASHGLEAPFGAEADASAARDGGTVTPAGPCPGAMSSDADAPLVLINEVFAGSLIDEQEDWFELHNVGRTAIALDGWTVEDGFTGDTPKEVPGYFEFPAHTTLCPGAYAVVARGSACEAEDDTFDFGIGSTDSLLLTDASGVVIDEAEWQDLPQEQSVGLVDDEKGRFRRLARPTRGTTNVDECACCGECLIGRCDLRDGACVATSTTDCRASEACTPLGWCGLVDGRCEAVDEDACRASQVCAKRGRCGLHEGACTVTSDVDCRASKDCENEGRCSADAEKTTCIATSLADCAASDDCVNVDEETGELESRKSRCTLSGDRCVATSCEDTTVCEEQMCCQLLDGKCVRG